MAELERKVDALTARLAEKAGDNVLGDFVRGINPPSMISAAQEPAPSPHNRHGDSPKRPRPEKRRRVGSQDGHQFSKEAQGDNSSVSLSDDPGLPSLYNATRPITFDHSDLDKKISQMIDVATAERLFQRYMTRFMPHFPAVVFPAGTRSDSVRKAKPILFLSIIASVSYGADIHAETQRALDSTFRDVLADCLWRKGEKSLEIVQALQVITLWYRPPDNFEQHMFYLMVHITVCMALDIGMGKRFPSEGHKIFQRHWQLQGRQNPMTAEMRRAWLTSYFLCTVTSTMLRRPIMVRFSEYTKECMDFLENPDRGVESDKVLCQHVRFVQLSEEIATQFALDDPAVALTVSDGKITFALKRFERDLADIVAKGVPCNSLKLSEHATNLYLHEIALYSQSSMESFKSPFTT